MRLCDNPQCKQPTKLYHRVTLDDMINTHRAYYFCNLKCLREWINNSNRMIINKGHMYDIGQTPVISFQTKS